MSNNQKGNQPLLEQIGNELKKAKRESLKKSLKTDIEAYVKAEKVLRGIENTIAEKLEEAGESADAIGEILQGLS